MKSSLEKFGRKLTMQKHDGREKKDHQTSAHLDELIQASKDMQDIRNCYDGLISAAAAMTNSIFEFSESLHEMGTCLLEKTTTDAVGESGRVLTTLGNIQSELRKIADVYRSYVIVTITNPSESLLSELRKVEEMKLQCDEKREGYKYMMSQHKEKGKSRSGKSDISVERKLKEAQDEYSEMASKCAFRVKSLKEGQCRSLLTQATRHHAAQLTFFRNGFKALEAVDPIIRFVAEKHRIDYQLTGLDNVNNEEGESISSYEKIDDEELSFDYGQRKLGLDNAATLLNPMEVDQRDIPHLRVTTLEDQEMNNYKNLFGRQTPVSSYSAPLRPVIVDSSEKSKETQTPKKYHSYVLPSPVDSKSPMSKTPKSTPQTNNPFSKMQPTLPVDHENNNFKSQSNSSIQLPSPSGERLTHSRSAYNINNNNVAKRQAYSGPLLPTKAFSGKIGGPTTSGSVSNNNNNNNNNNTNVFRSVSPTDLSSPKISELHELPRPPSGVQLSMPAVHSGGVTGHSGPLFLKNQETSKSSILSPLPPPPLIVSRSFSVHTSNSSLMSGRVMESPRVTGGKRGEISSPPLTPILLSNIKSTWRT